jgi:hypothetical protein
LRECAREGVLLLRALEHRHTRSRGQFEMHLRSVYADVLQRQPCRTLLRDIERRAVRGAFRRDGQHDLQFASRNRNVALPAAGRTWLRLDARQRASDHRQKRHDTSEPESHTHGDLFEESKCHRGGCPPHNRPRSLKASGG